MIVQETSSRIGWDRNPSSVLAIIRLFMLVHYLNNRIFDFQEMFVLDGDSYADRASLSDFTAEFRGDTEEIFIRRKMFVAGGVLGIIETSGNIWREQRRFALHTLRDFGMAKEEMQERVSVCMLIYSMSTSVFCSDSKRNGGSSGHIGEREFVCWYCIPYEAH